MSSNRISLRRFVILIPGLRRIQEIQIEGRFFSAKRLRNAVECSVGIRRMCHLIDLQNCARISHCQNESSKPCYIHWEIVGLSTVSAMHASYTEAFKTALVTATSLTMLRKARRRCRGPTAANNAAKYIKILIFETFFDSKQKNIHLNLKFIQLEFHNFQKCTSFTVFECYSVQFCNFPLELHHNRFFRRKFVDYLVLRVEKLCNSCRY